jgi:hypothetical protein
MYDATKTYSTHGDRGNSIIEAVEMEIDKSGLERHPINARFRITISPTFEQVRELIRTMPEAFDSIDGITN